MQSSHDDCSHKGEMHMWDRLGFLCTHESGSGEEQRSDVAYAAKVLGAKIVHKSSLRFA
jgi:hypothetical protein